MRVRTASAWGSARIAFVGIVAMSLLGLGAAAPAAREEGLAAGDGAEGFMRDGPAGPEVVGVISFTGASSLANDFAYSALVRQLVGLGRVRVVDRAGIDKILAEQRLQLSGFVDERTAVRVGQLLGMRWAFIGRINELSVTWRQAGGRGVYQGQAHVSITVLDVQSGEVVEVVQLRGSGVDDNGESARIEALQSAMGSDLEDALRRLFRLQARVVSVQGQTAYLSLGGEAGVREGLRFRVLREVRPGAYTASGDRTGFFVEEVGVVEVTRVGTGISEARILRGAGAIMPGDRLEEQALPTRRRGAGYRYSPLQLVGDSGGSTSLGSHEIQLRFSMPLTWYTFRDLYGGLVLPQEHLWALVFGMGAYAEAPVVEDRVYAFAGPGVELSLWGQSYKTPPSSTTRSASAITVGLQVEAGAGVALSRTLRLEGGVGFALPVIHTRWLDSDSSSSSSRDVTDVVPYGRVERRGLGLFLRLFVDL